MNEEKVQHICNLLNIIHLVKDDPTLSWVAAAARAELDSLHPDHAPAEEPEEEEDAA